ncbi:glycosyltransferase family 4 protein [Staphylococcus massiliensis]|uniref:glycosyltransferase family 4 protein n=1 Tax=Staphylococcus massiliensis TaxID=555791 RepID=UPI001EDEB3C4|nr:glycosyltransferase family 4 protein [Staphylococcus massiliensis]MCG3399802.1 glycosyltransferase family 4 protein [Staphylococcus massiliensis]
MNKKILIITQNFYPELGSAANRMKHLYKQFKLNGYETYVLTTEPSYPTKELFDDNRYFDDETLNKDEGKHILRLKMSLEKQHTSMIVRLLYYLEQMYRVRKYVNKHKHQFNYIYVTSPNIFLPWATLFFKGKSKSTYILEIRDLWPDSVAGLKQFKFRKLMPILKWLEKKMYQAADKIVVNNDSFKHEIKKLSHKSKGIFNLPNALTQEEQLDEPKKSMFSVIYTGNIGYAQNVDELIDIAKGLHEKNIPMTAIVYGVQAPKFREAIDKHQLSSIKVMSPMKRYKCMQVISHHHIALSILQNEEVFLNVMPGKIVDAISVGTPVVTNLGGFTKELIDTYKVGTAIKNGSVNDIIKAIEEYKTNHDALNQAITQSRTLRHDYFTWERNMSKLIKFIEEDV